MGEGGRLLVLLADRRILFDLLLEALLVGALAGLESRLESFEGLLLLLLRELQLLNKCSFNLLQVPKVSLPVLELGCEV